MSVPNETHTIKATVSQARPTHSLVVSYKYPDSYSRILTLTWECCDGVLEDNESDSPLKDSVCHLLCPLNNQRSTAHHNFQL